MSDIRILDGSPGSNVGATWSSSLCRGEGAWSRSDSVHPGGVDDRRLIVFPERRTVEVAMHLCSVHGGHLPVPENAWENKVRRRGIQYVHTRTHY